MWDLGGMEGVEAGVGMYCMREKEIKRKTFRVRFP